MKQVFLKFEIIILNYFLMILIKLFEYFLSGYEVTVT